jgi:MoxR-like ATPase
MIERLLIGLQGTYFIRRCSGISKTLAINTLSQAVMAHSAIYTDLLPADVVGTMIYNIKQNEFSIKKGPIFANLSYDEINRAPASAISIVMQEKQVTIGDTTFKLDRPFLVLATQNPIEQEGTYQLPKRKSIVLC